MNNNNAKNVKADILLEFTNRTPSLITMKENIYKLFITDSIHNLVYSIECRLLPTALRTYIDSTKNIKVKDDLRQMSIDDQDAYVQAIEQDYTDWKRLLFPEKNLPAMAELKFESYTVVRTLLAGTQEGGHFTHNNRFHDVVLKLIDHNTAGNGTCHIRNLHSDIVFLIDQLRKAAKPLALYQAVTKK